MCFLYKNCELPRSGTVAVPAGQPLAAMELPAPRGRSTDICWCWADLIKSQALDLQLTLQMQA